MAHTVRYPYHGTVRGGTGLIRHNPGAATYIFSGHGFGSVVGGGVCGLGTQKQTLTTAQQRDQERRIAMAKLQEQERITALSRNDPRDVAKRLEAERIQRAGRPGWVNAANVPLAAGGTRVFPRGVQMKIPGGLLTDTPPPDVKNLGSWVSSIVSQGLAQQERGGRILVGWARVAQDQGDAGTAQAYRNGALAIAKTYAPKKLAAEETLKKMQAEGRAPAGPMGDLLNLIISRPNYAIRYQAQMQGYGRYGQNDAVATAQSMMAEWEALAAEDPATGPMYSAVAETAALVKTVEGGTNGTSPEARATNGDTGKAGMGLWLALGAAVAYAATR